MARSRAETQRLIDENEPLMACCREVGHDLFVAERARAIWIWIGENAKTINEGGYGNPFGMWQDMALTEMFVAVGRAFDEERWGATYCIRRILRMMRECHLIDRDRFIAYLRPADLMKQELQNVDDATLVVRGFEIISRKRPTKKGSAQLEKILQIRHTEVAHNSEGKAASVDRPTFEDVDQILTWGKDFIGMIGLSFGSHVFQFEDGTNWGDFGVKSSVMALRRLTHKAKIVIDPHLAEHDKMAAELKEVHG